jgi:predicted permease
MRDRLGNWGRDFRLAVRGLLRTPGFTLVAVGTLALGLGGSAAIYTLLQRVVLDPLPYPGPDQLVKLQNRVPGVAPDQTWRMSTAQYVYFTEHARSFGAIGLYRGYGANINTPEGPQRAYGRIVTASVFPMLGARTRLGRLIGSEDDVPGGPNVAVLSHGLWSRQYGGDEGVLGSTINIDGRPFEIIGVLEPGIRTPDAPPGLSEDFWIAMRIDPNGSFGNNHVFPMIARLESGVDAVAAEAELARLTARLPERFPNAYSQEFFARYGFRTQVVALKQAVVGDISHNLWILFGALGLVLVIACANVANLFVVRLEGRRRELAIRSALGAGRAAIARHLVAESLVLSLTGGLVALLVGVWGVPMLASIAPESIPRLEGVGVDRGTIMFTALLSILVGLALAAYPIARRFGTSEAGGLTSGGRSMSIGRDRQRVRSALVVAQVALALTLAVGAGLLLESLRRLQAVDPGVDPEGVIAASIHLTPGRYTSDVEIWRAYEQILSGVRSIPGVTAAGGSAEIPLEGGFGCTVQGFEDPGVNERLSAGGMTSCAGQEPTAPGYFEAAGIPVLRGRTFVDADNDDPERGAVVVSQAFAERFWPGEDPIGKGVAPNGRTVPPFYHVVGVVGDVPASSLDGAAAVAVYYPIAYMGPSEGRWSWWRPTSMDLVIRTELADPASILPGVRRAIEAVDPTIPLANARSLEQVVAESMARVTFTSILLGIAAAMALFLAAVGLYGVLAYIVRGRTREIGIRLAIGALPASVQHLVISQSLGLVAVGLVAGLGLAFAGTRVMEGLLFGVASTDLATWSGAVILLFGVSLLASWIPARRASRVDPVVALRME